jgi:hypothetical protein
LPILCVFQKEEEKTTDEKKGDNGKVIFHPI